MTRHIIDQSRETEPNRLRRYLALERQANPHPATRSLSFRVPMPDSGHRLREFLRIERGRSV